MNRALATLATLLAVTAAPALSFAGKLTCWFSPDWRDNAPRAEAICDALSKGSGEDVSPQFAKDYLQILKAFASDEPCLVYIGSFVQCVIQARSLGKPLTQTIDGKEHYGSWMIYPKDQDPEQILRKFPANIAFAAATNAGESGAKAATGGKAHVRAASHAVAANQVAAGRAKAAFVKSSWWEANKGKYPKLSAFQLPGISDAKNEDNILAASRAVPEAVRAKIADAALGAKDAFGGQAIQPFDGTGLDFSLKLMEKAGIDPKTYSFED